MLCTRLLALVVAIGLVAANTPDMTLPPHMDDILERIKTEAREFLADWGPQYAALMDGSLSNNDLLAEHTNHFMDASGDIGYVYKIGEDEYTRKDTPENLSYTACSAVGYGLANSVILKKDDKFILIDAGAHDGETKSVIQAYRDAGVFPPTGKIPLRAIIYTHNHIDHTGGSNEWIRQSDIGACPTSNDKLDGEYWARSDCVEIVCHHKVIDAVINTATRTGQQINSRSAYMYGVFSYGGAINNGIGPSGTLGGANTFHPPTKTFSDSLKMNVLGLTLWLKLVPSETSDEIIAFVPDRMNSIGAANNSNADKEGTTEHIKPVAPQHLGAGLMASAEAIQGPSFPNLYSLRGTTFRNPLNWYMSVDIMRLYDSWAFVPSHGVPLMGKEAIQTLLVNFRDALQYVHDQTLRYMRRGYIPDELVEMVKLPPQLLNNLETISSGLPHSEERPLNPRDYLLTFYGSVPQGIRALYTGYLGWNEGDPTFFHPLPPTERANRYVEMFGGAQTILKKAAGYYAMGVQQKNKGHFQWVAELTGYVLRSSHATPEELTSARKLKGNAFLRLAQTTSGSQAELEGDTYSLNPNWRNWFVVGAEELALNDAGQSFPPFPALNAPAIQSGIPPKYWVQQWCWRYNSENDGGLDGTTFGWEFKPDPEFWGTKKQRVILEVAGPVIRLISDEVKVRRMWHDLSMGVSIDHPTFASLITKDATMVYKPPSNDSRNFVKELEAKLRAKEIDVVAGEIDEIVDFYEPNRFDAVPGSVPRVVERPLIQHVAASSSPASVAAARDASRVLDRLGDGCGGRCMLMLITLSGLLSLGVCAGCISVKSRLRTSANVRNGSFENLAYHAV